MLCVLKDWTFFSFLSVSFGLEALERRMLKRAGHGAVLLSWPTSVSLVSLGNGYKSSLSRCCFPPQTLDIS